MKTPPHAPKTETYWCYCRECRDYYRLKGESIGYNIKSKPEDAAVIAASLHTSV